MEPHARLWAEVVSLLRGLKDVNAHVLESSDVRCEVAGGYVLGRLDLLAPVRLTELASSLGLDPSSVSRQVSSLERQGWVTREEDPADRRATRLLLTGAGREVVAVLGEARAKALARLTPGWSAEDLGALSDQLARLNHDLAANRHVLDARLEHA